MSVGADGPSVCLDSIKVRISQVRTIQVRTSQVRITQVRILQVRPLQGRTIQVRRLQVRTIQGRTIQVRPLQGRSKHVRPCPDEVLPITGVHPTATCTATLVVKRIRTSTRPMGEVVVPVTTSP